MCINNNFIFNKEYFYLNLDIVVYWGLPRSVLELVDLLSLVLESPSVCEPLLFLLVNENLENKIYKNILLIVVVKTYVFAFVILFLPLCPKTLATRLLLMAD